MQMDNNYDSDRKDYSDEDMELCQNDGSSKSQNGVSGAERYGAVNNVRLSSPVQPAYYEPWHEASCAMPENYSDLYSPNYHKISGEYGYSAKQTEKPKREKNRKGMGEKGKRLLWSLLLIVVCGAVSSLCTTLVINHKLSSSAPELEEGPVFSAEERSIISSDLILNDEPVLVRPSRGLSLEPGEIYTLACDQTVGIQVSAVERNFFGYRISGSPTSGSGFIISSDGYIVTNYHVIETLVTEQGVSVAVQLYDGSSYDAQLRGYDADHDIAVLKINAEGLSPVSMGSFSECAVGDTVYAVGNPLGELTYTMTDGMICAMDRVISTEVTSAINVFQINAAVNSGNSGGPVYNVHGEVIGIVDAKYQATGVEGLGFAIPMDDAVGIIDDLIENGYVTGKAYLGVYVRTVTGMVAAYYNLQEGAYIDAMERGGCAEKAGLAPGDIIVSLGDAQIQTAEDLKIARSAYSAGDETSVTVFRNGKAITLSIVFDEEPSSVKTYNGISPY